LRFGPAVPELAGRLGDWAAAQRAP
jgi:hypothetical protein